MTINVWHIVLYENKLGGRTWIVTGQQLILAHAKHDDKLRPQTRLVWIFCEVGILFLSKFDDSISFGQEHYSQLQCRPYSNSEWSPPAHVRPLMERDPTGVLERSWYRVYVWMGVNKFRSRLLHANWCSQIWRWGPHKKLELKIENPAFTQ